MLSEVCACACVFTSETKNTQLTPAIGSVQEARGSEGEGESAAGRPAGSLKAFNPVGSWRKTPHTSTRPVALQPPPPPLQPMTAIYGSGIPVEKEARD